MSFETTSLLFLGLFAAFANLAGGLLILPAGGVLRRSELLLKSLVAAGAGFLLAVIFIEIVPRTADLWLAGNAAQEKSEMLMPPMLLLLGGYLLINFFEQTLIPHLHLESHSKAVIAPRKAYAAIGGLLFHSFFDGLALASALSVNFSAGVLVFLAVFLHKLPEGFTAVSLVLAAGETVKKAIGVCAILGLVTLLGIAVFVLVKNQATVSVAYVLPFSAGVALYVAASELIPELYHHGESNRLISLFVFAGVVLFFVLHYMLHRLVEI
ncbi:MAG: ZIP family metal transporter [Acidobacteriota bacterium]|nr:ZIP family metal transporter [Acidobacteriota bacterium]